MGEQLNRRVVIRIAKAGPHQKPVEAALRGVDTFQACSTGVLSCDHHEWLTDGVADPVDRDLTPSSITSRSAD